jgi:hypothetical protein
MFMPTAGNLGLPNNFVSMLVVCKSKNTKQSNSNQAY